MAHAAEIVGLRALGFSLAQVEQVLRGNAQGLEPALTTHQARLEAQIRQLRATVEKVRLLRGDIARGKAPTAGELARLAKFTAKIDSLPSIFPGRGAVSGSSCGNSADHLHHRATWQRQDPARAHLAEALPDAAFLGLERLADGGTAARGELAADAALRARVEQVMAWLEEDGASPSDALAALLVGLEAEQPGAVVVDMIEHDLDEATQEAVIAHLRRRGADARPAILLTRSCAILDLAAVGLDEAIIYCPANHSPPIRVAPHPGALGYEAVATCLARPEVRARTKGMIAWRPQVA